MTTQRGSYSGDIGLEYPKDMTSKYLFEGIRKGNNGCLHTPMLHGLKLSYYVVDPYGDYMYDYSEKKWKEELEKLRKEQRIKK
ncbi:hypothetical protein N9948_00025 [bacterium]|nr:hypothetical protein [bacterium]